MTDGQAATGRDTQFSRWSALREQHGPETMLRELLKAETLNRQIRSIGHQRSAARFPVQRDLDTFDFIQTTINEAQLRELQRCAFLNDACNLVLVGGPGTGKTHLAMAPGRAAIGGHLRGTSHQIPMAPGPVSLQMPL